MFGRKRLRKSLFNRLTMLDANLDPMTAMAIAYASYPSHNQPHTLKSIVSEQQAWAITENFLDKRIIRFDECCRSLFGKGAEEVMDAMVEDDRLTTQFREMLNR